MNTEMLQATTDSLYETREQQQKYLDTIRTENEKRAENIRNENLRLIEELRRGIENQISRIAEDQSRFRKDISTELENVRRWFASTIVTIIIGFGGVIWSIWAARQ